MNFTNEQLTKAKAAKSVEELLALAKENGLDLTEEEAKKYFADLNKEGEIADEELDNVAGGSSCSDGKTYSSDYPYYLITTAFNSCPDYRYNGVPDDNGHCNTCNFAKRSGLTIYCHHRLKGRDPF